jgi:RNA polymerase sigma factor (sigma-70 family)
MAQEKEILSGMQPFVSVNHLYTVNVVPVTAEVKPSGDFEAFYAVNRLAMVRLAWLLSGSREVAEDVVQDAFIQVQPALPRLRNPTAYLRRTVINGLAAHHRRLEVERRHRTETPFETRDPEVDETWSVILRLPDRFRQALVLRYYLDLSFREVAELLECPIGTAKSLVHRGLARVREELDP